MIIKNNLQAFENEQLILFLFQDTLRICATVTISFSNILRVPIWKSNFFLDWKTELVVYQEVENLVCRF